MLSGDICAEKTVQNMHKFSIETGQVRQHDVVAVVPKAVHGCTASEGDLRHRVAGLLRKRQHRRFGDGASPILLRKTTLMSHLFL